ncbi:MAG: transcriptional regulator GcvA [Hyphomicrobiales bacterium]
MHNRLPPLNALRAFEAAGRLLSMREAADELSVTPAAISHQIKALEEYFGRPLLHRSARSIRLSEAGATLLPYLNEGLEQWRAGCQLLTKIEKNSPLVISSSPIFASKWLMPRLQDFNAKHPEITVRVDGTLNLTNFADDDVNAVIRFGSGPYNDLYAEQMLHEKVVAICSPSLLKGEHSVSNPDNLRHHTLIHTDWNVGGATQPDWNMWAKTAGLDDFDTSRGPIVTSDALAIEAAINGGGLALVLKALVAREIREGTLIAPFDLTLISDHWYWFICPKKNLKRPKVKAFRDWIMHTVEHEKSFTGEKNR